MAPRRRRQADRPAGVGTLGPSFVVRGGQDAPIRTKEGRDEAALPVRRLLRESGILILFGAGSIVAGALGYLEVQDTIARENITATDDAAEQGADFEPGEPIDTGAEAKEFAKIIRAHVLEATGGRTYAEMGRYLTATGEETDDEAEAATDENGNPVRTGCGTCGSPRRR